MTRIKIEAFVFAWSTSLGQTNALVSRHKFSPVVFAVTKSIGVSNRDKSISKTRGHRRIATYRRLKAEPHTHRSACECFRAEQSRRSQPPIVSSPREELYSFEHDAIIVIPFIIQLLRTISVAIVPRNRIWDFLHVQSVEKDGSASSGR